MRTESAVHKTGKYSTFEIAKRFFQWKFNKSKIIKSFNNRFCNWLLSVRLQRGKHVGTLLNQTFKKTNNNNNKTWQQETKTTHSSMIKNTILKIGKIIAVTISQNIFDKFIKN